MKYSSKFIKVSDPYCNSSSDTVLHLRSTSNVKLTTSGLIFKAFATSTFVNCYVGTTLVTQENITTLLGSGASNIIVNNK